MKQESLSGYVKRERAVFVVGDTVRDDTAN